MHLLVGLGAALYIDAKRGHVWDGIFDKGSWMLVLIGVVVLAVGVSRLWAGYLSLPVLRSLLLTQGRHKKSIIGKIFGGLASIYDSTSYLSDILSYSRIFGMGLATTVIAQLFNTLGTMLMGGFVGYIFGIIVMTAGQRFQHCDQHDGCFRTFSQAAVYRSSFQNFMREAAMCLCLFL